MSDRDEDNNCADGFEPEVEPITCSNSIEEGAQRYWRASQIWRDKKESDWNYSMIIGELREISFYRGLVSPLSRQLLDDVIMDRRQPVLQLQPENMIPSNCERQSNDV